VVGFYGLHGFLQNWINFDTAMIGALPFSSIIYKFL